jgi:hypothetical protein
VNLTLIFFFVIMCYFIYSFIYLVAGYVFAHKILGCLYQV